MRAVFVTIVIIFRYGNGGYLRKTLRNCITQSFTPVGKPSNLLAGYSKKMQKTRPDRWFNCYTD
ncbi:hypothetical protein PEKONANI_01395 [Aeromonas jandaei]|nr:hypothetical protein AjGTCBM29_00229 [Aeromonas jandaei]BBQ51987.1 hypothetical protein WP2S18C03_10680 [Aeromonas veronii]